MRSDRPGFLRVPLLGTALLVGLGALGCGSSAPRRPAVTPASEARARVQYLRDHGGTLTPDQVRIVEGLPFRSTGPTDYPRVLRDGLPEPSVPLGERRSLLGRVRGEDAEDASESSDPRNTGEDTERDPQR